MDAILLNIKYLVRHDGDAPRVTLLRLGIPLFLLQIVCLSVCLKAIKTFNKIEKEFIFWKNEKKSN